MKHIFTMFMLLLAIAFSAQSQTLVSMTPSTGAVGTTVNVTISGNRTSFTSSTSFALSLGASVIPLSNVVALSATSATARVVIPANAASGSYTLLAIAGLGFPIQLPGAFTVTGGAPVAGLVSISPNSANQGQSLLVTITGVNTTFTQSSNTTVALTGFAGGNPIVTPTALAQNNTTLRTLISIPSTAAPGVYSLVVNTSNDGTLILPNAFTVSGTSTNTPKITAVTPASAKRGQTLNVTITGSNTNFTQGSDLTVSLFNAGSPLTSNFAFPNSNTSITANFTIPMNQTLGLHDVYVVSSVDGVLTLPAAFTITSSGTGTPSLVAVNPPYGNKGQTLEVTITGTNTHFTQGSNVMGIFTQDQTDGVEATTITVVNDTKITGTFTLPSTWANGLYSVGVMSDIDGLLEFPSSFSIVITGVRELSGNIPPLSIFPNPVNGQLFFKSEYSVQAIQIIDISGKTIQITPDAYAHDAGGTCTVNISNLGLPKGLYFLHVETGQGFLHQKFMVN